MHNVSLSRTNGPIDQFGRDFKTYLQENPDENRRFSSAWVESNVRVMMAVVQGFFDGLDLQHFIDTGARREATFSIPNQSECYAQRFNTATVFHLRC